LEPFVEYGDPNKDKATNRAAYSKRGEPVSVKYDRLVCALIPWHHESDDRHDDSESRIATLEAENADLKARLAKLEAAA
jgi:alkylated DNA repair dioxygenase AlkB